MQADVTTSSPGSEGGTGCTPNNICNAGGVLKILQIICTLILIICVAEEPHFASRGGVWVLLVAVVALLVLLVMFFLYICNVVASLPSWWCLVEFMFYSLFSVLLVTCAIAGAIVDHKIKKEAALDAAIAFSFLDFLLFHIDTFMKYHDYRVIREA